MTDEPTPIRVGVLGDYHPYADFWFNQCDRPAGRHGRIVLRPNDADADHVVLVGVPHPSVLGSSLPAFKRRIAKIRGVRDAADLAHALDVIAREPRDVSMLAYEPPDAFGDAWFWVALERCVRVYAPDERASHPITLPATWSIHQSVDDLRASQPVTDRPISLACVTSGKAFWEGHRSRLGFLRALRAAGIGMDLYGTGLDADLEPSGPVRSKVDILRGTRFTLAIENHAREDRYVTEKLWDPLLCWSLPLYYRSRAADTLIPSDAYIRIPSLDEVGIGVVRDAIADPGLWEGRLDAIRVARGRILGGLRLVEWMERVVVDIVRGRPSQ